MEASGTILLLKAKNTVIVKCKTDGTESQIMASYAPVSPKAQYTSPHTLANVLTFNAKHPQRACTAPWGAFCLNDRNYSVEWNAGRTTFQSLPLRGGAPRSVSKSNNCQWQLLHNV